MQIVLLQQKFDLRLGEIHIDQGQHRAMKGHIPSGEPRVFPCVGHGEYMDGTEVEPTAVSPVLTLRGWRGLVALDPAFHFVMVELFGPDHSGAGLPQDTPVLLVGFIEQIAIKKVCFLAA